MFFNQFDWNDTYGGRFPSPYKYTKEKLLGLNDHGKIVSAIEQAVDLRNFIRTDFEVEQLVEEANRFLFFDGLILAQVKHSYKVKPIQESRARREPIKNIIFGSTGPKPDIVLRDVLTKQIEVTQNAEHCLVYDHQIDNEAAFLWDKLVE